jgi:branched-subunit amino acid ABC-type transport system permease component
VVKATGMADCRRETEHGGCRCTESRARQEASRELTDIYVDGDACPVGGLAGAIYALIALAFVLVYKASRMINFALGEWIMFGSLLASTGSNAIGLDSGGAVLFGCAGMALLGVAFNAIVLGRLVARPVISVIMVTLGLGELMRGVAALCFRGVPSALTLPVSTDPVSFFGIDIAGDKLFAASIAAVCVCLVSWFFHECAPGLRYGRLPTTSRQRSPWVSIFGITSRSSGQLPG